MWCHEGANRQDYSQDGCATPLPYRVLHRWRGTAPGTGTDRGEKGQSKSQITPEVVSKGLVCITRQFRKKGFVLARRHVWAGGWELGTAELQSCLWRPPSLLPWATFCWWSQERPREEWVTEAEHEEFLQKRAECVRVSIVTIYTILVPWIKNISVSRAVKSTLLTNQNPSVHPILGVCKGQAGAQEV